MKKAFSTAITAIVFAAVINHYPQLEEKVVKAAQPLCAKVIGCFAKKSAENPTVEE